MTVIAKSWNRLTLPGKVIFTAIPLFGVLTVGLVVTVILLGGLLLLAINLALGLLCYAMLRTGWKLKA